MIITNLSGGLGNQMFQYACGKTQAARLGVELKLDISSLLNAPSIPDFTLRDYELNVFNIDDKLASIEEIRRFVPNFYTQTLPIKVWFRLKRFIYQTHLFHEKKQNSCQYNCAIEQIKDNTCLYGYFQNENYFAPYKDEILKIFTLRNAIDTQNQLLIDKINSEESVSVHIRRGDYLHSCFNSLFHVQDLDYYQAAIDQIQQKIKNPSFYIFTTDYEWTKEQFSKLKIPFNIVDINKGSQSYMDMILMSKCKHNIIANSSFSWWGAWLNRNEEKMVIAPKIWYKHTEMNNNASHIIPNGWITI